MTVGKIWYEATREERGRPAWDAIVVDAPATGHSLAVPAHAAGGARDLRRRARAARGDEDRRPAAATRRTTAVHLVTLAEEMPVTETLETRAQLVGTLGMPLGLRGREPRSTAGASTRRRCSRRRARPRRGAPAPSGRSSRASPTRAAEESGWTEHQRRPTWRACAPGIGDAPLVELPFLFAEEFGRRARAARRALLEEALGGAAARRRPAGAVTPRATLVARHRIVDRGGQRRGRQDDGRGVDRALGRARRAGGRSSSRSTRRGGSRPRSASRRSAASEREIPRERVRGAGARAVRGTPGRDDARPEGRVGRARRAPRAARGARAHPRQPLLPAPVADASPARTSTWRSSSSACSPRADATT